MVCQFVFKSLSKQQILKTILHKLTEKWNHCLIEGDSDSDLLLKHTLFCDLIEFSSLFLGGRDIFSFIFDFRI